MRFQCTECDETHATFDAAARCHWGIGGVVEVEDEEWDAEAIANEAWSQPPRLTGDHPADDPRHITSDRY